LFRLCPRRSYCLMIFSWAFVQLTTFSLTCRPTFLTSPRTSLRFDVCPSQPFFFPVVFPIVDGSPPFLRLCLFGTPFLILLWCFSYARPSDPMLDTSFPPIFSLCFPTSLTGRARPLNPLYEGRCVKRFVHFSYPYRYPPAPAVPNTPSSPPFAAVSASAWIVCPLIGSWIPYPAEVLLGATVIFTGCSDAD